MKLPSTIRFADRNIQDAFYKLEHGDDSERELFKLINQAMDNENSPLGAICGRVFGIENCRGLIPRTLVRQFSIILKKTLSVEFSFAVISSSPPALLSWTAFLIILLIAALVYLKIRRSKKKLKKV